MSGEWSAGALWLAECAPRPAGVLEAWSAGHLAVIPALSWTVVEAPSAPSFRAMGPLGRAGQLGPVLVYPEANLVWWLLPDTAAEHLADLAQLTVHEPEWLLHCPPPGYMLAGRGWIPQPDGTGKLTDPVALGAEFGPAGGRLPLSAFV